jgi:hypothetical protein|tara:strand:+ start:2257 stop:2721 length:465 start_codon:yes stop_codon:yes gene_type:complete
MTDRNSSPNQLPQLYSLSAIGIATFFGSLLAGGFLISENYRALGMKQLGYIVLAISLFAFCLSSIAVANFVEPMITEEGEMLNVDFTMPLLINIAQVLGILVITHVVQGSMLATFTEMQGTFHSTWRAVGLSLVAYIVLATVAYIILSTLGLNK